MVINKQSTLSIVHPNAAGIDIGAKLKLLYINTLIDTLSLFFLSGYLILALLPKTQDNFVHSFANRKLGIIFVLPHQAMLSRLKGHP